MISLASLTIVLIMGWLLVQYKFADQFPQMLSFPKSHNIEGMIRFQFSKGDTIEG